MNVNDTLQSDGFFNDVSKPLPETLKLLKELDKHFEGFGGLQDIKGVDAAKADALLKQSSDKFFYHFDKGKAICKDLKTMILDQPKKSISDALQDIEEKFKDKKIFFGQRIKNKDTEESQYIVQEEHKDKFDKQDVIHKQFDEEKNIVETTVSKAEKNTAHAMSIDQYANITNLILSRMEMVSATFLAQQEQMENPLQDLSLAGRVTVLREGQLAAQDAIKNLMERSFAAQRRGRESRLDQQEEQRKYHEAENLRKEKRAEKNAEYEKRMENYELQEESKALNKGESPRARRSFHTKPS